MRIVRRAVWGLIITVSFLGTSARAEVVLGAFTGVWDSIYGPPIGISLGDTFSGTFSYDTGAADFDPHPASGAFYTPMTVSLSSGVLSFSATWQAPLDYGEYLHIVNNYVEVGNYDSFQYYFRTSDASTLSGAPAGIYGISFFMELFDSSGTAFDSTMPSSMNLSAFNPANRRAGISAGGPNWWGLYGNLTSLTVPYSPPPPPPVPEPSSAAIWSLVVLGAGALGWYRRGTKTILSSGTRAVENS